MCKVIVFACLLIAGLSGCSSVSGIENGKTSYAYQVIDKDNIIFDEIVVGNCYTINSEPKILNTHVILTAILNPSSKEKETSLFDDNDARTIIRSAYPRISAQLVDYYIRETEKTPNLKIIRTRFPQIASEVFDPIFSKWKHADLYKVEFVVTSIYCTDGSVGRTASNRPMWW